MLDEVAVADAALGACVEASVWALPEPALVAALDAVHALEQRLAAVKLALVREVDGRGVPVAHGASSTAVWLRQRLRLTVPAARRLVETAGRVDAAPTPVRDALAAGAVTCEQARVIADTVATVSQEAGAEAADKAVGVLLDWAGQFERRCCAGSRHGFSITSPPRWPRPLLVRRWRSSPPMPSGTGSCPGQRGRTGGCG